MLAACMLLCERKPGQWQSSLPVLFAQPTVDRVYINYESPTRDLKLEAYLDTVNKPYDLDYWHVTSTWQPRPKFDQDQLRLIPITRARNMCVDYCMHHQADWLLFLDSDMILSEGAIEHLLSLDHKFCGGYVPGRGDHSHVHYVFPGHVGINEIQPDIIECHHGNIGFALIHRDIFWKYRFRYGLSRVHGGIISDDPAFGEDVELGEGIRLWIHKLATVQHFGDLKADEAAQF